MNEIQLYSEKAVLGNNSSMERRSALQDMVFKLDQQRGNKQKTSVWLSLFCFTHLLSVSLNNTANKIKPDVAGYGRHAGALGYAGQGAKGNGI